MAPKVFCGVTDNTVMPSSNQRYFRFRAFHVRALAAPPAYQQAVVTYRSPLFLTWEELWEQIVRYLDERRLSFKVPPARLDIFCEKCGTAGGTPMTSQFVSRVNIDEVNLTRTTGCPVVPDPEPDWL